MSKVGEQNNHDHEQYKKNLKIENSGTDVESPSDATVSSTVIASAAAGQTQMLPILIPERAQVYDFLRPPSIFSYLFSKSSANTENNNNPAQAILTEIIIQKDTKKSDDLESNIQLDSATKDKTSFMHKLWNILSLGVTSDDAKLKITELTEVKALPEDERQQFDQVLNASFHENLSSTEIVEKITNEINTPLTGEKQVPENVIDQ